MCFAYLYLCTQLGDRLAKKSRDRQIAGSNPDLVGNLPLLLHLSLRVLDSASSLLCKVKHHGRLCSRSGHVKDPTAVPKSLGRYLAEMSPMLAISQARWFETVAASFSSSFFFFFFFFFSRKVS